MALTSGGEGSYPYAPYCGAPPAPTSLLDRWNLDPILITLLLAALCAYAVLSGPGPRRGLHPAPWRRAAFYGGWTLAALALISPLCALSVALFSARIGQHMILLTIAAPLAALGFPPGRRAPPHALTASLVSAATLWIWHAPGPYEATFNGPLIYWLMHLTTFGAAVWLWRALFDRPRNHLGDILAAGVITTLQMAFLGAVIAFAGRAIYRPHLLTTWAWGLTPLGDQQLGAVLMWVPAGVVFVATFMGAMTVAMRRPRTVAMARGGA